MIGALFAPLGLPILQFVALLTTPATALYAIGGLLASPIVVPLLILKNFILAGLFLPLLLLTAPVAVPVGFLLACLYCGWVVCKSFCVILGERAHQCCWQQRCVVVSPCVWWTWYSHSVLQGSTQGRQPDVYPVGGGRHALLRCAGFWSACRPFGTRAVQLCGLPTQPQECGVVFSRARA
jgi:hypothetical protein